MTKIIILLIAIFIINLLEKSLNNFNIYKEKQFNRDFLEYGFISAEDLKELDEYEFYDWIKELVNKMGYKFIREYANKNKSETKFIYEKNSSLGLMKMIYSSSSKIGVEALQQEVGFMASKNLIQGVFITSSAFDEESKAYIKSISDKFNISLIDGDSICNKKRQLWY